MKDSDPLESESTQSGLVASAAGSARFVEGFCPEGARDGLADPLDEGLTQEGWAGVAPVHPAFVAAALGDGRDTGILLQGCGVGKALASFTEGNEEPRSKSRHSAGQRGEELVVGQRRRKLGDRGVEALDSDRYSAQLWEQRLDEQAQRVGHRGVGVQRALGTNRLDAALDSGCVPDVAGAEEIDERVAACTLSGLECRPALEEVSEDGGLFVAKPAQYLREVGFERARDAVGQSRPVF